MVHSKHAASGGEKGSAYKVMMGKPKVKRPLGRHRHRWEDNIEVDLKEIEESG
jgi:hypothetical protein